MRRRVVFTFLFICTFAFGQGQSLWQIYNSSNSFLPADQIWAIEEDRNGSLWIGTDEGLARFDGSSWIIIDSSNSDLPSNQIRSIAFDTAGRLWVGTLQTGFSIYDGATWQHFNSQNSDLPDDQVRCITFDSHARAWVGTTGGVAYESDEGWISYTMFNSPLGANNINTIFIDHNDVKWIGTVNGGISKKEGNAWTIYKNTNSGLTDNTVNDFDNDVFGNLWFTTPAQGLGRFNGSTWFYRLDVNSQIPSNSLTALEIAKATDVKYIGSYDKGLIRWNNGVAFDSFTVNNSPLPDNHITCLKRAQDGKLWVGTASGGVAEFNDTASFPLVNAIVESQAATEFAVYPNPALALIFIESAHGGDLKIYNVYGKPVLQKHLTSPLVSLNIGWLSGGSYFISLRELGKLSTTKHIIKQ